jgi:hypothetical protein
LYLSCAILSVEEGIKEGVVFGSSGVLEAGMEENVLEECDKSKGEDSVVIRRPSGKASLVRHWLSCA